MTSNPSTSKKQKNYGVGVGGIWGSYSLDEYDPSTLHACMEISQ
jgi:hypothetical protein